MATGVVSSVFQSDLVATFPRAMSEKGLRMDTTWTPPRLVLLTSAGLSEGKVEWRIAESTISSVHGPS